MPTVETFKNVPELFEGVFEESIKVRTETMSTFKQLGPDDLVHVIKNIPNSRQQIKEVSSYHFVVGVDTSSSASIAAYINSLTYSLESKDKWFNNLAAAVINQSNSWNISKCTFCAFNAFEGVDVRVEARIPGGVKSFVVDVLGGKRGTDADGWQETFLSSILRQLKSSCGGEIFFTTFIDNLNFNTTLNNNLNNNSFDCSDDFCRAKRSVDGLFNLQTEMRFLEAANKSFFKGRCLGSPYGPHLAGNHDNFLTLGVVGYFCLTGRPEIAIGFLKPFAEKDPHLKGLIMKCHLQANNQGLAMKIDSLGFEAYDQMADFLISRQDLERAEKFASEAIKANPHDYRNWHRMVKIKTGLGEVEKALIILNNTPMSAYSHDGTQDFFKNLPKPVLISLPGTQEDESNNNNSNNNNNNNSSSSSTSSNNFDTLQSSPALGVLEKLKSPSLKGAFQGAFSLLVEMYRKIGWNELLQSRSKVFVMEKEYITSSEDSTGTDEKGPSNGEALKSPLDEPINLNLSLTDAQFLSQTGKKLCERWLDNLFLMLFEDLRIYALFEEEMRSSAASGPLNKSSKEWYLLGGLSMRLKNVESAKLAFQKTLFSKGGGGGGVNNSAHVFDSLKIQESALNELIKIYCQEGRSQLALLCAIRLISMSEKVYQACQHPTRLSVNLTALVTKIGLKRVESDLRSILRDRKEKLGSDNKDSGAVLMQLMNSMSDSKVHGYDY